MGCRFLGFIIYWEGVGMEIILEGVNLCTGMDMEDKEN
jgi:hypothetical protein